MAKGGLIKTIQKNIPFKKLSTTFISLAMLFILSIVLYFIFNKYIVEGNENMKAKAKTKENMTDPIAGLNNALSMGLKKEAAKETNEPSNKTNNN